MQSIRLISKGPRGRRHRKRAKARDRPRLRRGAHSFEALEGRFLLTGIVYGPIGHAAWTSHLLPLPADVVAQIPSGPRSPSSSTVETVSGQSNSRDDSYILDGQDGQPTVRVDLIWPAGANSSAGRLLVSDSSRRLLYDVPLTGVDQLNAVLPIPSGTGVAANLDINLQISGPGTDPTSTGSYRIDIHWAQAPAPISVAPAAGVVSGGAAGGAAGGPASGAPSISGPQNNPVAGPVPPPSGITATRNLPASPSSSTLAVSANPIGGGAGPVVTLTDPGLSRISVLPPSLAIAPASASSSNAGSSASPTLELPMPSTSGLGSSSVAGGNRAAVVGALPLSGSGPDGGIFAYPYSQTKGGNDPFRSILTIGTVSETFDAPDAPHRLRRMVFGMPVPFDILGDGPSISRPLELEMTGSLSATGAAFLPPIDHFPEVRVARQSNQGGASRWPILYSKIKPKTSLAALFVGSTSLFLGLVAPDCLTRLTAWQEDRQWRRQLTFGASKQKPQSLDDV